MVYINLVFFLLGTEINTATSALTIVRTSAQSFSTGYEPGLAKQIHRSERTPTDTQCQNSVPVSIIELEEIRNRRGCSGTIRWTPAHKGVESNEMADTYAKWAAEARHDPVDQEYLSLTPLVWRNHEQSLDKAIPSDR